MPGNTLEAHPPLLDTTGGRPRPPPFTRSISEIPPSPTRLHHLQAGDDAAASAAAATAAAGGAQQPYMHGNRTSLDVSSPTRPGVLSARSTPGASRSASFLMAQSSVDGALFGAQGAQGARAREGADVKMDGERKDVAKTVTGLKQSLVDLGDLSSETTRLLDDTYSSVLEKMGILQTTILGLKEVALQSREVTESFGKETAEVTDEVETQIHDFNNFQEHEERIRVLRKRVDVSRDTISALGRRVGVVRDMVEGWERADKEWQERTRRRLMVIWGITSAVIFALVLLYLGAQYRWSGGVPPDLAPGPGVDVGVGNASLNASGAVPGPEVEGVVPTLPVLGRGDAGDAAADERLRMLDEL